MSNNLWHVRAKTTIFPSDITVPSPHIQLVFVICGDQLPTWRVLLSESIWYPSPCRSAILSQWQLQKSADAVGDAASWDIHCGMEQGFMQSGVECLWRQNLRIWSTWACWLLCNQVFPCKTKMFTDQKRDRGVFKVSNSAVTPLGRGEYSGSG